MSATRITTSRSAKGNADFQAAENVHVSVSRTGPRSARAPCARLAGTRVGAAWALGHETRLQGVLPRARPAAWLRGHRSVPVWGAVTMAPQTCGLTVCTRVSSRADESGAKGVSDSAKPPKCPRGPWHWPGPLRTSAVPCVAALSDSPTTGPRAPHALAGQPSSSVWHLPGLPPT